MRFEQRPPGRRAVAQAGEAELEIANFGTVGAAVPGAAARRREPPHAARRRRGPASPRSAQTSLIPA